MADFNLNLKAEEIAAAHDEPTITVGRLVYRGRLLSIEEWLPFLERQLELEGRKASPREMVEHWVKYLYAVFPRRGRFRTFAPDPVAAIRSMPGNALQEAYLSFFFHQARVLGYNRSGAPKSATTPKSEPGTISSDRTADGPNVTARERAGGH